MAEIWTIERKPGAHWVVDNVRHLTGEENHGNHHVYVDAKGPDGADLRNTGLNIYYGWDGMREDEATPLAPINKPAGEFGCNVPIFSNTTMYVGMHGAPSDIVRGLRTDFGDDDGQDGNSWGHQSFHVVFRYRPMQAEPESQAQPEPQARGILSPQPQQGGTLTWEYHPPRQGTNLPHYTADVTPTVIAWVVEGDSKQSFRVIAYLTSPGEIRLTSIHFSPNVEQAKQWAEEEAQKLQYHQE